MYLISKELAKDENYDVNFAVLDLGQGKIENIDNVKIYKTYKRGRSILNLIKAPLILLNILRKINPDVVICRANGVEVGISAFYAKLFKKRFIYSIAHDGDINGDYFSGLRGKIFKYGFKNADSLVAQSEEQLEKIKEKYSGKDSRVIKNSFEVKDKDFKIEKNIIFWVASSAPIKRPEIFIRLAKDFVNEKFVMVMTKSKLDLSLWNRTSEEVSNIKNLEIIEKVPFKVIDNYFSKTKVFINTSKAEGFPNTFLQSMINKVPILSLKVNPDNFIHECECGVACDDDYDKLKQGLDIFLENGKLRERLGENGYNFLKKEHNIENNILKWKELLK